MAFFKKKSKGYLISVCAGVNQIPLIREASELGYHVIGIDNNPQAPGFLFCDLKIQESVENHESAYIKLRELMLDENIAAIMTKSYGHAICTASYLAEKFGIPYIPYSSTSAFLDKKIMRERLKKAGVRITPKNSTAIKRLIQKDESMTDYPIVAKPVCGHAKTDVIMIKNKKELQRHFNSSASNNDFIYEKYVPGKEIIAIGIVHNSKYYLAELTDKITTSPPYFVDLVHSAPSEYSSFAKELTQIGQTVADEFGIQNSPLIIELIVSPDNELFVIEAVPEFGGEFLTDVMVPARTGYRFIREAIKSQTGDGFHPPVFNRSKKAGIIKYITAGNGILASVSASNVKRGQVQLCRIFKDIGAAVRKPANNLDRIGVIASVAGSMNRAKEAVRNAEESLKIVIKERHEAKTVAKSLQQG